MENGTTTTTKKQTHPLEHAWQLYLHYPTFTQSIESYAQDAYQALCEFSTVEGFWQFFHFLPKPSDVFTEVAAGSNPPQLLKRKLDGKSLEAFGLFKKGVKPEWEDPINVQGGHWECRRDFDLSTLDKLWTNTVLALIGETLEDGKALTGVRVVDKSKNKRPEYRLEIWSAVKDMPQNESIRKNLLSLLQKEGEINEKEMPEFVWKEHSSIVTTAAEGYGGSNQALSTSAMAHGPAHTHTHTAGGGGGEEKEKEKEKAAGGGLGGATASIREKVFSALRR